MDQTNHRSGSKAKSPGDTPSSRGNKAITEFLSPRPGQSKQKSARRNGGKRPSVGIVTSNSFFGDEVHDVMVIGDDLTTCGTKSSNPSYPDIDAAVSQAVAQLFKPSQFRCRSVTGRPHHTAARAASSSGHTSDVSLSLGRWTEEQRVPSSVHRVSHSERSVAFVQIMDAAGDGEFAKPALDHVTDQDNILFNEARHLDGFHWDDGQDDDFLPPKKREEREISTVKLDQEAENTEEEVGEEKADVCFGL